MICFYNEKYSKNLTTTSLFINSVFLMSRLIIKPMKCKKGWLATNTNKKMKNGAQETCDF